MVKINYIFRTVLITAAAVIIISGCTNDNSEPAVEGEKALVLVPIATFSNTNINESSGIVTSNNFPGIFWTHNDSGGTSTLYPVYQDGTSPAITEISISGATNVDWEDITIDNAGSIYVADTGNNAISISALLAGYGFDRTDLCIYKIPEPSSITNVTSGVVRIPFHYPEWTTQTKYNFDAEALFWARGTVYLLTKHFLNTETSLYRFNSLTGGASTPLELRSSFDVQGSVTAADASSDGNRLVVLVNIYQGFPSTAVSSAIVWLFEATSGDNYFSGTKYRLRIDAGQCEAICFIDSNTLLITSEDGKLYKLNINQLKPYN